MAQVARDAKFHSRIDDYLDYLSHQWEGIPSVAAAWPQWDEHSRLVFALDWPLSEDRLEQLRHWAEEGAMSPIQTRRYSKLLRLVAKYRSLLEQLLKDEAA